MNLSIIYKPNLERPYLLKRENGEYKQHAHFHTRKMAEQCRKLIDLKKYPYSKEMKIAMQRLLSEEEFKKLNRKQRYYNVNKGTKKLI